LPALGRLEESAFAADRLSRRSFLRFLDAPSAVLIVAEADGDLVGYVLTLFRSGSRVARIYSIAVMRAASGHGVGRALLAAAEETAAQRGCVCSRLEVSVRNGRAADLYRRSGYRPIERLPRYYADGGDAERFEKLLAPAGPPR
jgi:ribosomal-protein-alanine N-acetyltransferase